MLKNNKKGIPTDFDKITLRVASPDRIREWSYGEVTKPETINYRTQRSEKSGLFDEKIFGPDRDYECYCGKYRGIRYKGIVCEKCGVEITRSIVRRERMGHIELSSPVSHIWFLRSTPSRIGLILGMSVDDLEKVVYFAGYIVTHVSEESRTEILKDLDSEFKAKVKSVQDDKTKEALKEMFQNIKKEIEAIKPGAVLDEVAYHNFSMKYSTLFKAGIGAESIYNLCKELNLETLVKQLEADYDKVSSVERERINKRLSVLRAMIVSGIRPEWMFLTTIPVIPPALRPMVPLDGGRYATSDVNDLYRRVINRNNRLKKLKEINAPEVILRNEKRILQEAVDALIDNSLRHGSSIMSTLNQAQRRPLKSLADNLKGKRGLFRQNLLGKRVDYSGRSVIVVGPELKIHQCGLPKHMALELFRPFVIAKILEREFAYNIRGANRLIDDDVPEVWAILEEVIADKYVLLNRAPTLHRLGIQAFKPVLIEGSAIQVHPLVCTAFNADFDGDQMAVHLPLSQEAQTEAVNIMAADKNILKPGSGDPTVSAKMLDIVLGSFWMTKILPLAAGARARYFESPKSASLAFDFGAINFREPISVIAPDEPRYSQFKGQRFETTVGRITFNQVLPEDYPFLNKEIDRKDMAKIVETIIDRYGIENVPPILDRIKQLGFFYATRSGVTWGIDDIKIPEGKKAIIQKAKIQSEEVQTQYNDGLLSMDERMRKNVEIWHGTKNEVERLIPETLDKNGSVYDMWKSGARGSLSQLTQMAGMKGLIQNTAGETIEFPILSCSKEGLTPIEYFITTHGSRKGLTDTALNTAKAGYLTRKLFVVAQDVVVTEIDCGSKESIIISSVGSTSGVQISIAKHARGRFLAEDLEHNGKTLFKRGALLTKEEARKIEELGITAVKVRSPLGCKTANGICATCYGLDLGKNRLVDLGEAVGTVAAQAIGEPGTQLTMRTFHAGGTASVGGDITQGLPRVEEIFEKRAPKNPAIVSHVDGTISEIKEVGKEKIIVVLADPEHRPKTKKKSTGVVEYSVHYKRMPLVRVGDAVKRGDILTDGSVDIDELFENGGIEKAQNYIISEVTKPYELQGETVSRKHIEVIVRQMFSRKRVKDVGGTSFSIGDMVTASELNIENEAAKEQGNEEAKVLQVVMGITEASLSRRSFLASASFQHTARVLISSAVRGATDHLTGLMENVIIGRLIPAGTGFAGSPKRELIAKVEAQKAVLQQEIEREMQRVERTDTEERNA
ncbi:MAG: DNA-directed RNA polymerase subunit beta' [Candidatus Taylorbacteria bacterium RIFCSPHIGHO2_01_FULL_46_22b]|uniref:DNA-directed RNA polymerase subunit beta' n=1 Tax=Candidatus Taylorbacteria bacterium RIFCSPHIGHO2_01_FULL_46_22b TaxID=1802301 RepID=A0A1G2M4B5_9BACT|nr:MAG: DNA-directed RNA polymerase subunit beta' [Candidatus Taylorbacteria bacterium RIFCSPHIGHO2_01_FULL_46_22b]